MPKVILSFLILITLFNLKQLTEIIFDHQIRQGSMQLHNLGDQFKGLETILKDQRTIGYYTDKNFEDTIAIAQFEQAQYHLAPTVLDLNQTHYPFVIVDCSSPQIAINKMKKLGLQPIKANNFGIILAINPQAGNSKP